MLIKNSLLIISFTVLLLSCDYEQTKVRLHPDENYMEILQPKTRTFGNISISAYNDSSVKVESYYAQIDTLKIRKFDFQKVLDISIPDFVQRNSRVYMNFSIYNSAVDSHRKNIIDVCSEVLNDSIIQLRTYEFYCRGR